MSRTYRKRIKNGKQERCGEAQTGGWKTYKRKMKPYTKDMNCHFDIGEHKEFVTGYVKGITNGEKLTVKNANRGQKKALRQQLKKELKRDFELEYMTSKLLDDPDVID